MNRPKIKYSHHLRDELKQNRKPSPMARFRHKIQQFRQGYQQAFHAKLKARQQKEQRKSRQLSKAEIAEQERQKRALRVQAKINAKQRAEHPSLRRKRIKRDAKNHKKRSGHVNKAGLVIAAIIVIAIAGGSSVYFIHSENAQARQSRVEREQKANEVSCTLKATPKSPIYDQHHNQVAETDKSGSYQLQNAAVGTKLYTVYGHMKSNPLVITKADSNKPVTFTFNYLKGNQAQQFLMKYYQCVSNLANHNDQNHDNSDLSDYFVNGSENGDYKTAFSWGKRQYKAIQKHKRSHSDKGDTAKDEQVPFNAVHFTVAMQNAVLNQDGTVTLNFGVREDFAGQAHDHIEVFNISAVAQKKHGHWMLLSVHKPGTPKTSYNN